MHPAHERPLRKKRGGTRVYEAQFYKSDTGIYAYIVHWMVQTVINGLKYCTVFPKCYNAPNKQGKVWIVMNTRIIAAA